MCLGALSAYAQEEQQDNESSDAPVEPSAEPDFGGSFSERLKLTGNWGGARQTLASHGMSVDLDVTHVTQWIVDGGFDGPIAQRLFADGDDVETGVSADLVFQLDTEQAGLWPGGFLKIRGEARFGEYLLGRAGTISPIAADSITPLTNINEATLDISEFTFMQFFSERFGVILGLLNTFEGDGTLFASGRGDTQFLNTSLVVNAATFTGVPYQSLGAGIVVFPTGDPEQLMGTLTVMNTEDASGHNPFDTDGGTTVNTEWYYGYTFRERPGRIMAAATYADFSFTDLESDPRLILLPGAAPGTKDDTWNIYFNASQYVQMYESDPSAGWGLFGRLGFSDGNPNPVEWFGSIGVGGNVPKRTQDTFGIGMYHAGISSDALLAGLGIDDETGFEMFYNVGITPWFHVTVDFQVIDSGLPGADTPVVLGLRTRWNF